jgi:4-hydroxy-tetrahydrodipicolinate synthase
MFRGVGTALVTPFTPAGALDERALEKLVDWQIAEGIDFLVPCGTTGENPALTADEHRRVVEIVVRTANGRVPVLAGAGSNATPRAVELAVQAIDLGADGILTITPYYNKPTPDGLRGHFGAQAEAVEKKKPGFPMILYNVPGRTGVNMSAATTLRMAREIPNVIGVKEASANMEQILEILRLRPEGFLVLSGDDAWTLPLLGAGADGLVSVASNEVPRLMHDLVANRDLAIHNRLLPLLTGNFLESSPGPVKTVMKMLGILEHETLRPPLAPVTEATRERLSAILDECGLTANGHSA